MKALKWIAIVIAMLTLLYIADEQSSLESAWGKPMRQNEEWRW